MCLVGVALLVLLGCCLVRFLLLFDSAWWNRGIAEEVTMASYGKAVTGTAVMARSANEEKKKNLYECFVPLLCSKSTRISARRKFLLKYEEAGADCPSWGINASRPLCTMVQLGLCANCPWHLDRPVAMHECALSRLRLELSGF